VTLPAESRGYLLRAGRYSVASSMIMKSHSSFAFGL